MSVPDLPTLFRVLEATWPAAGMQQVAGWTLRDGAGGGKRASAATAGPGARAGDAPDLVMVRPWDGALDAELAALGYGILDDTRFYVAPAGALAGPMPIAASYTTVERLAMMEEIWTAGGVGPGRLAVMDRVTLPKVSVFSRAGTVSGGVGFVALSEGVGMIHAIEVMADRRRKGAARALMRDAANWTLRNGGEWVALAVTAANEGARALYTSLGMIEVGGYHYRVRSG